MFQDDLLRDSQRERWMVTHEEAVRWICDFLDVHGYHSSLLALQSESGIPYNVIREEEKPGVSSSSEDGGRVSEKGFETAVTEGQWHVVLKQYLDRTLLPQDLKATVYEEIVEEMLELYGLYHAAHTLFRNAPIFQYLKEHANSRYARVERRLREFDALKVEETKESEVAWSRIEKYYRDRRVSLWQELRAHVSFTTVPRQPQKAFLVQLLLEHKRRAEAPEEFYQEPHKEEGTREKMAEHVDGTDNNKKKELAAPHTGGNLASLEQDGSRAAPPRPVRKHPREMANDGSEEEGYERRSAHHERVEKGECRSLTSVPLSAVSSSLAPPPPSLHRPLLSSSSVVPPGPQMIHQIIAYEGNHAAATCATAFHTTATMFATPPSFSSQVLNGNLSTTEKGNQEEVDGTTHEMKATTTTSTPTTAIRKEVVVVGRIDGTVDIVHLQEGKRCYSLPHASNSGVLTIVVENLLRGHPIPSSLSPSSSPMACPPFSSPTEAAAMLGWVAVGYRDGWVKLYDLHGSCAIVREFGEVHRLGVTCLAFAGPPLLLEETRCASALIPSSSPCRVFHHSWVLSGSFDGSIKILDIFHGGVLSSIPDSHRSAPVNTLCTLLMIRPEKAQQLPPSTSGPSYTARFRVKDGRNDEDDEEVKRRRNGGMMEREEEEEIENEWEKEAFACGEDGPSSWAMDGRAWLSAGDDGRLLCWYVASISHAGPASTTWTSGTSEGGSSSTSPTNALPQGNKKGMTSTGVRVEVAPVGKPTALALRHLYDKFDGSEKAVTRVCRLPQSPCLYAPSSHPHPRSLSFSSPSSLQQMTTEVLLSTSGEHSKVLLLRLRVAPHAEEERERLCTEALCWFTNPMAGGGGLYNVFPSVAFPSSPLFSSFPGNDTVMLHVYAHEVDGTVLWATVDMIWRSRRRWREHVQHHTVITSTAAFSSMSRVLTEEVGEKVVKDLHFTQLAWVEADKETSPKNGKGSSEAAVDRNHPRDPSSYPHKAKSSCMECKDVFFVCSPSLPNAYVLLSLSTPTSE